MFINRKFDFSYNLLAFVLIFFSCQRFVLPELTSNLAILVLPLVIINPLLKILTQDKIYILLLLLLIDKSSIAYEETTPYLKYAIYFCSLIYLYSFSYYKTRLYIWLSWLIVCISLSISNVDYFHTNVMLRDSILILSMVVYCTSSRMTNIDLSDITKYLVLLSGAMLVSELVNIILFYDYYGGDYLSYSPFKILVLIASLFYLLKKKYIQFTITFIVTLVVIINFQTRMILVFYLLSIILLSIQYISNWLKVISISTIILLIIPFDFLVQFRVLNILYYIDMDSNIYSYLYNLDPIRFAEHKLILEQPIGALIFGDGPGIGIYDAHGLLDFVKVSDHAFTAEEIKNNVYFRLHDSWIYLTQRFGLIFFLLNFLYFSYYIFNKKCIHLQLISITAFLLFNLSTYSTSGILMMCILISIIIRHQNVYKRKQNMTIMRND